MKQRRLRTQVGVVIIGIGATTGTFGRGGGGGHSGGGGGHSSGGSSSHSSGYSGSTGYSHSYSSSGGGGNLSPGGVIALLIVIMLFWLILRRIKQTLEDTSSSPSTAAGIVSTPTAHLNRPRLPPALETIRTEDSGFEIESFLQRAEMSFFLVKRGMQRNDPASVRPYVNDVLFAELARSMSQMQAAHRHTLLESLNVRAVHLDDASYNEQGQSLEVHFDLVYRAKSFDDSNRVVADEGTDRRRGERWTFVRSSTARTSSVGDVTASHCPACGAELKLSLDGVCTHCKASVTNGSVDWVVADIRPAPFVGFTSDSQMATAASSVDEGVSRLHATDQAFSMDAFRTRVRGAFTTLQEAWCKQDVDAARAFMSPGTYFAWRAQLETMVAEGRRNVMEHLQIRSIQPVRIVHGRVFDDLTVRITAVSADYDIDAKGHIVFGDRTVRPFSEEWTFQRAAGMATSNQPGTLENTCPSCGAPVVLTQIGECRYCKAAVTSGKFDWVLSRIEQEDADTGEGSVAA